MSEVPFLHHVNIVDSNSTGIQFDLRARVGVATIAPMSSILVLIRSTWKGLVQAIMLILPD